MFRIFFILESGIPRLLPILSSRQMPKTISSILSYTVHYIDATPIYYVRILPFTPINLTSDDYYYLLYRINLYLYDKHPVIVEYLGNCARWSINE